MTKTYKKLNLGCGRTPEPGYENVDHVQAPHVDHVVDLDQDRWPWADNTFAEVKAHNVLEHLANPLSALQEIARITMPTGKVDILVPHRKGSAAYQVAHRSYWDENSLVPLCREGKGEPGLDIPHLFRTVSTTINHTHPFCWHQRKWLGEEKIGWKPHQVRWVLEVL